MLLPVFLKCIGVRNEVQMGLSIGTAAHAVGTSRAIELGETEGAMSGLAIGIAGLLTALIVSVGSCLLYTSHPYRSHRREHTMPITP